MFDDLMRRLTLGGYLGISLHRELELSIFYEYSSVL